MGPDLLNPPTRGSQCAALAFGGSHQCLLLPLPVLHRGSRSGTLSTTGLHSVTHATRVKGKPCSHPGSPGKLCIGLKHTSLQHTSLQCSGTTSLPHTCTICGRVSEASHDDDDMKAHTRDNHLRAVTHPGTMAETHTELLASSCLRPDHHGHLESGRSLCHSVGKIK